MIQAPLFRPQTEWLPPEEFPDLSKYDEIAIDLETKDPDLVKMGSGSVAKNGDVVGIAVAVNNWSGYYPIAHEGGGNMDRAKVLKWFQGVLDTPALKIFHNAMYDVCWIRALGGDFFQLVRQVAAPADSYGLHAAGAAETLGRACWGVAAW